MPISIGMKTSRLKIAYLTLNDPRDRRSWSGTHYYMAQALQRHCGEVVALGPIRPKSMLLRKLLRKALEILTGREYLFRHCVSFAKETARIAEKRLANTRFDLIFAPVGSAQVAYLNTDIPIVYSSDATFSALLNYYPECSGVSQRIVHQANTIEQLAIDRASLILYSSSWAAESARKDYHADAAKVHVVPFGANLDEPPPAQRVLNGSPYGVCKLLFIGVHWARKGGDIALETLVELERLGVPAQLTVVGCTPSKQLSHRNLRVFHSLNKNDLDQRRQLEALYLESDFLLLPTRAECYGVVFCEANAFGLPAISTDTGGVSEIIRNGENGFLLPPSARGAEYARVIADVYADKQRLQQMRRCSRLSFDRRLNWDTWGKTVADLFARFISAPVQRSTILSSHESSTNAAGTGICLTSAHARSLPGTGSRIRVIRTLEEVDKIRPVWSTWRGHRDADIDVYQTVLASRSDAARPHIIVVERDRRPDAMLVGMATRTTVSERIAYWTTPVPRVRLLSFQYGGFLGNQSEENSKFIVDEIERALRHGDADVAVLNYVREETPLHQCATHVRSGLMRDHFPTSHKHWMIDLPQTTDGIYAAISREHRGSQREEIRKSRKFREAFSDLKMVQFQGTDRLEELLKDAEQVAATTYQRGLGVGFCNTRPIRDLLTLEAKKGWLRGHVLYAGGRPCAFEIGCLYNGVFLGEYLGHDPAFVKYAPGIYLLTQVIERLDQEEVTAIDWGIGDAFYKRRFGNKCWNESTVYLYAPTWAGMRAKAVRTAAILINSVGKSVLERAKLAGRVKKLWRKRVIRGRSRISLE
jgi:glycosyltransferase involved in cell wall biosynthesis